MNQFEFVIAIIAIVTLGSILKAKYGLSRRRDRHRIDEREQFDDSAETVRLREEVRMLKDRIQTLERIAVDKENSLARQIDELRDR